MTNHTPGPWFTSTPNEGGGILIKPIPGQVVAQCDELPEMEANAQLIAAAPELLEALEEVTEILDMVLGFDGGYPPEANGPAIKARNAIAKARGEQV